MTGGAIRRASLQARMRASHRQAPRSVPRCAGGGASRRPASPAAAEAPVFDRTKKPLDGAPEAPYTYGHPPLGGTPRSRPRPAIMSEAEPLGLFLARVSNDQSCDPYRRRILPEAVADGAARHRFGRRGRRRQGDRTAAFPSRGARGRRAPRRVGVAPRSGPGRARPPTRGAPAFAACRHRPRPRMCGAPASRGRTSTTRCPCGRDEQGGW